MKGTFSINGFWFKLPVADSTTAKPIILQQTFSLGMIPVVGMNLTSGTVRDKNNQNYPLQIEDIIYNMDENHYEIYLNTIIVPNLNEALNRFRYYGWV